MLESIRDKIGFYYLRKAYKQLRRREYGKAFKNLKRGVRIVSPSEELMDFGENLRQLAMTHKGEP